MAPPLPAAAAIVAAPVVAAVMAATAPATGVEVDAAPTEPVEALAKTVEAKPAAAPAAVATKTPLSPGNVDAVWQQVLNSLSGMMADHAAEADKISVDDKGQLTISFGESFHRDICERPDNRARLEKALQEVCGTKVGFAFRTHQRTDAPARPTAPAPSKRQQQVEISTQPFVKRAMELFDGDPARLRYVPPTDNK